MNFSKTLINWYSNHKRNLPWRHSKNPYHIWLSEIILQQTQVKQGLPYYEKFIAQYPDVFALAHATEEAVLKLWQGLGYYSRARNLHAAAQHIAFHLNGTFPNTYKDLLKLKGVGDYTASAIASIAFKESTAVVDGNVYRVLSRFFGIDTPINSTEGIKEFKSLATKFLDQKQPDIYNQALMEFGALQCKPKNPKCDTCPLQQQCVAFNTNQIHNLPVKLKKTKVTNKYFNFMVCLDHHGRIMIEKRASKGIWHNLYQFPLIESNRSLDANEFHLLDLQNTGLSHLKLDYHLYNTKDILHKLSHRHLYTKFWIIETPKLPAKAIPINELEKYPVPALISDFITTFNFTTI